MKGENEKDSEFMISDKQWLRKLGEWIDWQDESFGERELRNYMMLYDFVRFHKAIRKDYDRIRRKKDELIGMEV